MTTALNNGFTSTSGATSASNTTSTSNSSLNSLTSSDFLQLMITQLQQQDPLDPTDSNQMLSQISEISQLQSSTQMQQSLSSLTLQQSIGAGGNLVGKSITGLPTTGSTPVTGNVTNVQVINQAVYLGLDNGATVAMSNVTQINNTASSPSIASGGNLIGMSVTGTSTANQTVTGTVTGVQMNGNLIDLVLNNGAMVPESAVTLFSAPTLSSSAANTTVSNSTLGSLVSALSGIL